MKKTKSEHGKLSGSRKTFDRKTFLRLGGVGLAGAVLVGASVLALRRTILPMPAPELGISPGNSAGENRENLVAVLRGNPDADITFPPGKYQLENSSLPIHIEGFGGALRMEEGAYFEFTDSVERGITFVGGEGAFFEGLTATYRTLPYERNLYGSSMIFLDTTGTVVRNADIKGASAVGLYFANCLDPRVSNAVVRDTMADGLHFHNCRDARTGNLLAENTGDDGLAFVNRDHDPDRAGGHAANVTVRNGKGRGIAVVGQRDVTIDGFLVDGTSFSGLYCAQENSWNTRVSSNVKFTNGEVHNAGRVADPAGKVNPRHGIHYLGVESVEFTNIKVFTPAASGVAGEAGEFTRITSEGMSVLEPSGTVTLNNVEVYNSPESGFALQGGIYYLEDLTCGDVNGRGIFVGDAESVNYGKLTSINASKTDSLRRAFDFENNKTIEGAELHVVDDQETPTGYKITTFGTQSGTLGKVYDRVANGELAMENHSGLAVSSAPTSQARPP